MKGRSKSGVLPFQWSLLPLERSILLRMTFVMSLFIFSYLMYRMSLSFKSAYQVVHNIESIIVRAVLCILSYMGGIILLYFSRRLRKIHRLVLYLFSIFILIPIFIYDQRTGDESGEDEFGYGYFASRFVIILIFFLKTLYFALKFLIRLLNAFKIRKLFVVLVILVVTLSLFCFYSYHYVYRKSIIDQGLFGVVFDEEMAKCRINNDYFLMSHHLPRYLLHTLMRTYWCTKDDEFVEIIPSPPDQPMETTTTIRINKQTKSTQCDIRLFPNLVDHYRYEELRNFEETDPKKRTDTKLQKWFLEKTVTIKNIDKSSYSYDGIKYETALVECDNNERNIIVNPKRKYNKEEEDKEGERSFHEPSLDYPNIILLWFDCESRKLFEYDFPESIHYIKENIHGSEHRKYEFYQFFSHHVVGWNTYPQFLVMFNGQFNRLSSNDMTPSQNFSFPLWEVMRQRGYLTVYADDECNDAASRYNKNPRGNENPLMFDHTHLEPFCLPEYTNPENPLDGYRGAMSAGRRCLMQKEGPEYVFDYLRKIEVVYPDTAKFMYAMFDEAHEATGESIRYVDRYLKEYLQFLVESGTLENSVVFMFADHGNHASMVLNMLSEGKIGRRNPMLYMIKPRKYELENQEIIAMNQHRFVTGLDLHKTWSDMVGWDWEAREVREALGKDYEKKMNRVGINLLREEVPYGRTCPDAGVMKHDCESVICKK